MGYLALMLIGLGYYTKMVLADILANAVNKETSKVINTNNNDLKNKITQNFKKIEELNTNLNTALPIDNSNENKSETSLKIPKGYSLVNDTRLSRRLRKEKERCNCSVFH